MSQRARGVHVTRRQSSSVSVIRVRVRGSRSRVAACGCIPAGHPESVLHGPRPFNLRVPRGPFPKDLRHRVPSSAPGVWLSGPVPRNGGHHQTAVESDPPPRGSRSQPSTILVDDVKRGSRPGKERRRTESLHPRQMKDVTVEEHESFGLWS